MINPELDLERSFVATHEWLDDESNRKSPRRRTVGAIHRDLNFLLTAEGLHRAAVDFAKEARAARGRLAKLRRSADDLERLARAALFGDDSSPRFADFVSINPSILDEDDILALAHARMEIDTCMGRIEGARDRLARPRGDPAPFTADARKTVLRSLCRRLVEAEFTYREIGGLIVDKGVTNPTTGNGRDRSVEEVRGERYRKFLARDPAGAPSKRRDRKSGRKRSS